MARFVTREMELRAHFEFISKCTVPFVCREGDSKGILGTGTLFLVDGAHYIVTAGHVIDDIQKYGDRCTIPAADRYSHLYTTGTRKAIKPIRDLHDLDVGVVRLESEELINILKAERIFLTLENVLGAGPLPGVEYLIVGFPLANVVVTGDGVFRTLPLRAVTVLYTGSTGNAKDTPLPAFHILLEHAEEALTDIGLVETVPPLNGISGCSIWAVTSSNQYNALWKPGAGLRVAGVATGYIAGRWVKGTRWLVVAAMLRDIAANH